MNKLSLDTMGRLYVNYSDQAMQQLRDSFELVLQNSQTFTDRFFNHFMGEYPALRKLFESADMHKLKKAFIRAMSFVTNNLENPERLSGFLQSLGTTHRDVGIKELHFTWFKDSWILTISSTLGDHWNDSLHDHWNHLIDDVARLMRAGLTNEGLSQDLPDKTIIHPMAESQGRLSLKLPDELRIAIRGIVIEALHQAIRDEVKEVLMTEIQNVTQNELIDYIKQAV